MMIGTQYALASLYPLVQNHFGFILWAVLRKKQPQIQLRPEGGLAFDPESSLSRLQCPPRQLYRVLRLPLLPSLPGKVVDAGKRIRVVRPETLETNRIRFLQVRVGGSEIPEIPVSHAERVSYCGLKSWLSSESLFDLWSSPVQGLLQRHTLAGPARPALWPGRRRSAAGPCNRRPYRRGRSPPAARTRRMDRVKRAGPSNASSRPAWGSSPWH
jgi:hypothetical protein